MNKDKGCSADCTACKRPFGRSCICGNCLAQPDGEGLGDLFSKIRILKQKSIELQDSLKALMEKQRVEEQQQLQLSSLRVQAHQTRVATQRAERKLHALNSKYKPADFDASLGLARVALVSAIDQLGATLSNNTEGNKDPEHEILGRLQNLRSEHRLWQRRALSDVMLVLEHVNKTPDLPEVSRISAATDLVEQCATNQVLNKYYPDAFGQLVLLLGVAGAVLQLPLRHRWRYGGTKTQIWLPESFFETDSESNATTYTLNFIGSSSSSSSSAKELQRKGAMQALVALERTAAVALSAQPDLCPHRSLLATPMEWIEELCTLAMEERGPGRPNSAAAQRAGHDGSPEGARLGGPFEKIGAEGCEQREEDEEEWELMAVDALAGLEDQEGGFAQMLPSLTSVVERVRSIANYNYYRTR